MIPEPTLQQARTSAACVAVSQLTAGDRARMLELFSSYFANVSAAQFAADLAAKDSVLLIRDRQGVLQGFSTVRWITCSVAGMTETAIFSGDTVLQPALWGRTYWIRAWALAMFSEWTRRGRPPVWWLLLTATHRSYRCLPAFFRQFFPGIGRELPTHERQVRDSFLASLFPSEFYPDRGVVRLSRANPVLPQFTRLATEGMNHRDAEYFAECNPGFLRGDFLVCLAKCSLENLTPQGLRLIGESVSPK